MAWIRAAVFVFVTVWLVLTAAASWVIIPSDRGYATAHRLASVFCDNPAPGLTSWQGHDGLVWAPKCTDGPETMLVLGFWEFPNVNITDDRQSLAMFWETAGDIWTGAVISAFVSPPLVLVALTVLGLRSRRLGTERVIRGRQITTDRRLARDVKQNGQASDLMIGRVPLVRKAETFNTLILGAQGTGKTSALEQILAGIEKRGEAAVVYDYGPGLMQRFYRQSRGDIILNPLDGRSATWSPWSEIRTPVDCAHIAEALVPAGAGADPFWPTASRMLLKRYLMHLHDDPRRSVEKLLHMCFNTNADEMERLMAGTPAASLFKVGAERTGTSVEINTNIYVDSLGLLPADAGKQTDFSIRSFIESLDAAKPGDGRPWLWLPADPGSLAALKPLLSVWCNAVISGLLQMDERLDRRLWVIVDELATLHALPMMKLFLHNGRKKGGAGVMTLQSPEQLKAVYPDHEAKAILAGFQTVAAYRIEEIEGQTWASKAFGYGDIEDLRQTTQINGPNSIVGLQTERRTRPAILPTEFGLIPDLACYVKLPGPYSVAKTEVEPRPPLSEADAVPGFVGRAPNQRTAAEAVLKRQEPVGQATRAQKPADLFTQKQPSNDDDAGVISFDGRNSR